MKRPPSLLVSLLAVVALAASSGCAAVPLSALSSLSSLGDSTVSVGRDAYSFGKLRSAELTSMFAAQDAAIMAAHDLGLRRAASPVVSEDGTEIDMAFVDAKGAQIGVRVEERTPKMIFLREDVGWLASLLGAEVTDRLFLFHLRQHLPPETKAATKPATDPAVNLPIKPPPPADW